MLAVTIGEAVPRFDLLMGLVGALLTGPLMFLLPPLFYVKIRSLRRLKIKKSEGVCYRTFPNAKLTPIVGLKRLALLMFIILAGTLATILSTVSGIRDTIIYAKFTPSCIMQLFEWHHLMITCLFFEFVNQSKYWKTVCDCDCWIKIFSNGHLLLYLYNINFIYKNIYNIK